MSKIESTSKVSLKLPSRINLGRQGARVPSSRLWAHPTAFERVKRVMLQFQEVLPIYKIEFWCELTIIFSENVELCLCHKFVNNS